MNEQALLENTCIILPFRFSSSDRKTALHFVLNWLAVNLPEAEVLIVEQDGRSMIDGELPATCRHILLKNDGLFNKCWGYNAAAAATSKEILIFNDSDMFMSREDYLATVSACTRFDAVNPSATEIQNIINTDTEHLTYKIHDRKAIWTFAGGIFAIRKSSLEQLGGWNEEFEGWGAEDNELSFRILSKLSTIHLDCAMYHIEHERGASDWKQQAAIDRNKRHFAEISTLAGASLDRFIERLRMREKGNPQRYTEPHRDIPQPEPRFVMAVHTYNEHSQLSRFIREWDATKAKSALWTLIVADDGSGDETEQFLENLHIEGVEIQIIRNHLAGKAHQLNSILYCLESLDFDVCFIADPHVSFLREGWDFEYMNTMSRTGFDMLSFYDRRWNPARNLSRPQLMGNLACHCRPEDIQDFFFTLTPQALSATGYFDTFNLGTYGLERVDYLWRGFRTGFNALHTPFDIRNSNDYLKILKPFTFHYSQSYISRLPGDYTVRRHAWNTIFMSRGYFPRNEIVNLREKAEVEARLIRDLRLKKEGSEVTEPVSAKDRQIVTGNSTSIPDVFLAVSVKKTTYRYADMGKITSKGISGLAERMFKSSYNLLIRFRLRRMMKVYDKIASGMITAGILMKNIDK